eukprot:GHVN01090860.1.p1 GENE.GHVN01090860.1~~GHVN01090860.1.p1  ORF type:complete len:269 (-),score=24.08 GHVN01090860.1:466-1272(-)
MSAFFDNSDCNEHTEYTVFVGNPGVGKSRLLNGLSGTNVFKSGLSWSGSGVTTATKFHILKKGKSYIIDTAGLGDDLNTRSRAYKKIIGALSQNGRYRVIFVVQPNGGRVMGPDAHLLLLESVPAQTPFAIILNKVASNYVKRIKEFQQGYSEEDRNVLRRLQDRAPRTTSFVHLIERVDELDEEDDVMPSSQLLVNLKRFLSDVPFMHMKADEVGELSHQMDIRKAQQKKYAQELKDKLTSKQKEILMRFVDGNRALHLPRSIRSTS